MGERSAAESEHGAVNQSQGGQDEEGGIKDRDQTHALARDSTDDETAGVCPVQTEGQKKGKENL